MTVVNQLYKCDTLPFTFSHPALILPLAKYTGRYFSLTSLIIGSLCPDFEYFFKMKVESLVSHTAGGLFYFNLPVSIVLAFVFHNLIRNCLYKNLPPICRSRLEAFMSFDWNNYFRQHYLTVIISILIGAASHLLWDSFTHLHGYSVHKTWVLQQSIVTPIGASVPVYKLLQHLSTCIGGLAIMLTIFRLPATQSYHHKTSSVYWLLILLITSTIICIRFAIEPTQRHFGNLIVTGISAGIIALAITPFLMRIKARIIS